MPSCCRWYPAFFSTRFRIFCLIAGADTAKPLVLPSITVQSPASVILDRSIAEMETQATLAYIPKIQSFQEAQQYQGNIPVPAHPAIDRARSYNCELGTVILTSGLSRSSKDGNHALDFALISVDNARFPGLDAITNVSNRPSLINPNVDNFKDPCSSAINAVFANRHLFKEVEADQLVVKTSVAGTTLGKAAGLVTIRFLVEVAPGHTVPIESRELAILSHSQDAPFSRKGDSGSVVRDATGRMVGMLWGGLEPGYTNNIDGSRVLMNPPAQWALDLGGISFVTPIEVLLDEMQDGLRKELGIPVVLRPLAMSGPSVSTMVIRSEGADA
jgi:hypothetical protein